MVTIKDVARVAGVSSSTVSRVVRGNGKISEECRDRIKKIIVEMGYRPNTHARALVSQKSEMLGVVTPNLSVPFFGSIAQGAEHAAREANYKLMMANSHDTDSDIEAINSLREHGCENIVLHSRTTSNEKLVELAQDMPGLIIINRLVAGIEERCVWLDNFAGGKMAADHLMENGHTKLAIISSSYHEHDSSQRILGIQAAVKAKLGGVIPEENIVIVENSCHSHVEDALNQLFSRGVEFTGILAYNDFMAITAMNLLQDRGVRVPENLSIMGFDNTNISEICRPLLTTIHYPIVDMAIYAAKLSLALTNDKADVVQQEHLFKPSIVIRKSVAALR